MNNLDRNEIIYTEPVASLNETPIYCTLLGMASFFRKHIAFEKSPAGVEAGRSIGWSSGTFCRSKGCGSLRSRFRGSQARSMAQSTKLTKDRSLTVAARKHP